MLENLALSENGFLFDAGSGNTFSLNPTGAFILKELIAKCPEHELIEKTTENFQVDQETVARDLEHFKNRLKDIGLLSKTGEDLS